VLPVRRRRLNASLPDARAPRGRRLLLAGVAAAALLAAGLATLPLLPTRTAEMREIIAHRGERLEFGLPDGSHVVLGAASRLRYAAEDFARDRALYLDGQGYFAVAHDTRHPFVVHARGAAVQAVGTEFGVRAYGGDSTLSVAVAKGRVLVRTDSSAPGTGTVLDLGDLGQMDSVGRTTVHRGVNLDQYLGWVRGRLIYDMAPPAEVVRDLERWYDVSIHADGIEHGDLRVSMTIDPTQPAPVSFQRLADVLDLHVVRTGNSVELVPRSGAVRRQLVR
jgi:transmembrane sensor